MKTYASIPVDNDNILCKYRDLIERRIKEVPDIPLFKINDYQSKTGRDILPGEFLRSIDMLGRWFQANGCVRSHIAVLGDNSYQWILTMFSIICSDNVIVTLDKGLELPSLEYIVEKSESRILFYSSMFAQKAQALSEKYNLKLYALEELEELVKEGEKLPDTGVIQTDENALAILMFTSGTTGTPKGVMLSQKNAMSSADYSRRVTDLSGDTVFLLPLNHIYGLGSAFLIPIISNSTVTINSNMRYMMNDIQSSAPEILFIVPLFVQTLYAGFVKFLKTKGMYEEIQEKIEENRNKGNVTPEQKREMFAEALAFFGGRLNRIISGGAPLDMVSYEGFRDFGITVLNGYGITECSPVLAVNAISLNKPESVGRILSSVEVRIENPDEKGYGEICAKGPTIMMGYFKNDEENRKSLVDGWFHTGDKGWIDDDDYLYVCGRIKNLIILSNGENVSPEELEGFIYKSIPAVAEVVVYDKDSHITAQVYPNDEYIQANSIEDGKEHIKNEISKLNLELAVYKRISEVEFRDTPFEKTTSKKIKRLL